MVERTPDSRIVRLTEFKFPMKPAFEQKSQDGESLLQTFRYPAYHDVDAS